MTVPQLRLPPGARVLVVALRRLGDVLLTTPLIRSLRRAWPDATLDVLVFADTAGILEGNPDVERVVAMPVRPTLAQSLALAMRLFKRYHLAVSTQSGDRPIFFALLAGRDHVGPVWPGERAKRALIGRSVAAGEGVHRVEEMLRLADALGIARVAEVVVPTGALAPEHMVTGAYAVVHAAPMFRYKQWTRDGWRARAQAGPPPRRAEVRPPGAPPPPHGGARGRPTAPIWTRCGATAPTFVASTVFCAGPRSPRSSPARGSMSVRTRPSPIWRPRPAVRRSRSSARPTPACGGHGRRTGCPRHGRPPEPSSSAAMYGWCRTRCRACPASRRAAIAIWRAARSASTS